MEFNGKYQKQFTFIANNYEFRFNIVASQYEFREIEYVGRNKKTRINTPWKKYDDRVKNRILLDLMQNDCDIPQDKYNIFVESEEISPDYDPFAEYFENLEPWDEKTDYVEQIANTIKTNDNEHFKSTLMRFLVGTLDCLLEEDNVNDVCLVFQSGQGIGKSRWMRSLLPKKFQKEYLYEGEVDTKNKDHTIYLSQYWFMHLDELEAVQANKIGALKSYITRQRISERKAYGRYKARYIRRASFLGSVNDDKFLSDITGNRRWLIFRTLAINYEHNVNIDGLWAQIFHLWKNGFKHWFDIDEIKIINKINEQYRQMSFEEEMLVLYYEFHNDESRGEFMSAAEVLQSFNTLMPTIANKMTSRGIGKALTKYSKLNKVKTGITKYFVLYKGVTEGKDTDFQDRDSLNIEDLKSGEFAEKRKIEQTDIKTVEKSNDWEDDDDMPF